MGRTVTLCLTLALVVVQFAGAQHSFQVPITIQNDQIINVYRLGVNPGNSIGVDNDTTLRRFAEGVAPPVPPFPLLDARFVTIPGRVATYPVGLGGGVFNDFRGYQDTAQVDSFRIQIQGDNLTRTPTILYWPAHLDRYAVSWTMKSIGSAVIPGIDMVTVDSVVIPADPLASIYNILIVKQGVRPSVLPAASVSLSLADTLYHFFDNVPWNNPSLWIQVRGTVHPCAITAELYMDPPAGIQFGGTPPLHYSRYRWVISQYGLGSFSARIKFLPKEFKSNVTDNATIKVYRRPTEGSGIFQPATVDFTSSEEIQVITSQFGEFVFGADNNQLLGVGAREAAPAAFRLEQNYPNPFNPSTTIRYVTPGSGEVSLKVFNLIGQEVSTLVRETQAPGLHAVTFNAEGLPSGMYIYRLQFRGGEDRRPTDVAKRMIFLK